VADVLIFSRNRPMQLDACLRSLEIMAPQLGTIRVLVKATDDGYQAGYETLAAEHPDVHLSFETVFHDDARRLLAACGPYVLMLCDDSITYLPLPGDPDDAMEDDVLCFSLRLGRNTVYCYPRDLEHGLPRFTEQPPFLTWGWHESPEGNLFDWQGKEGDFGYPYSLDGAVHRRDSLLAWVEGHEFTNPNKMEGGVISSVGQRVDLPSRMACFPRSVQVGLPLNVVNVTHSNRVGMTFPHSPEELNERFLAGERVDLAAMDFSEVRGAHQEIALVFA